MQLERRALYLALANTGNKIAANRAIMAMTTNSSMSVNALRIDAEPLEARSNFRSTGL